MNEMTVNAPASLSGTIDVDEFMAFMETRPKGEHWDLIEGVAVMMAPSGYLHQLVASNFRDLLNSPQGEGPRPVCFRRCRRAESWAAEFSANTGCGDRIPFR
jgi:hypothetical protein